MRWSEIRSVEVEAAHPGESLIAGRSYVSLSSNDYLGLANDERVLEAGVSALSVFGAGSRAARSFGGNTSLHRQLEDELAEFIGAEAALLFGSGYLCNVGTVTALVGVGDVVLSDRNNHASIIDGARLSGADIRVFEHMNIADLRVSMEADRQHGERLIAADSVFSMDGTMGPVPDLTAVARKEGAMLLLDDAHAVGAWGSTGRGSLEYFGISGGFTAMVGTLGKALGSAGAYVVGDKRVIEHIAETARTFLFTTALSPCDVATALQSLLILRSEPERIERLWFNATSLHAGLLDLGFDVPQQATPIIPVFLGDGDLTSDAARYLRREGVLVGVATAPFVAPGRERLRIIASAGHTPDHIDRALHAFSRLHSASTRLRDAASTDGLLAGLTDE